MSHLTQYEKNHKYLGSAIAGLERLMKDVHHANNLDDKQKSDARQHLQNGINGLHTVNTYVKYDIQFMVLIYAAAAAEYPCELMKMVNPIMISANSVYQKHLIDYANQAVSELPEIKPFNDEDPVRKKYREPTDRRHAVVTLPENPCPNCGSIEFLVDGIELLETNDTVIVVGSLPSTVCCSTCNTQVTR